MNSQKDYEMKSYRGWLRDVQDIYLERLASEADRVQVRIAGATPLDGEVGWVDANAIETAGEKCTPGSQ